MLLFATEGVRVLEKKVNETQVSKTVLSHLKVGLNKKIKYDPTSGDIL